MNLLELRQRVQAVATPITFHSEATLNSPGMLNAFINEAYHVVESRHRWKFSERDQAATITNGIMDLNPAEVLQVRSVYDLSQGLIIPFMDLRQVEVDMTRIGEPLAYFSWAGQIGVWPNPGDGRQFRVRYYFAWPDLVLDTDEPVMPKMFHHILSHYAVAQIAYRNRRNDGDFAPTASADSYMNQFTQGLEQMFASWATDITGDALPNHMLEADLAEDGAGWW